MERFLSGDASSGEAPTEAAELDIRTVPVGVTWAESSALPEVRGEAIKAELDWNVPGRPRPRPDRQLWNSPDDDELTSAADLRIMLVPLQADSPSRGPGRPRGTAE